MKPTRALHRSALLLVASSALLHAGAPIPFLEFDTSLSSLNLSGGPFPMPLASDPSNALGDSVDGYGFVDAAVSISLSSQRVGTPGPASTGQIFATPNIAVPSLGLDGNGREIVDPGILHGTPFSVDSFFDVFFDITVTDVDSRPGRDFAGQPDGASLASRTSPVR